MYDRTSPGFFPSSEDQSMCMTLLRVGRPR